MYEEARLAEQPEIHVDLDAEYFKWKEGAQTEEAPASGKKERKFLFGRKSGHQ